MKFLFSLQRFPYFLIGFNSETKCCKPLANQSHCKTLIPTLENILTKHFSLWHARNIPALNNTAQWHWDSQGTAWQIWHFLRDPYKVFTRSVRDLGFAREDRRARHSTVLNNSVFFPTNLSPSLYPTLSYSFLQSSRDQTDAIKINMLIIQECCVYVMHRKQVCPAKCAKQKPS